jgi:hypothetical protein
MQIGNCPREQRVRVEQAPPRGRRETYTAGQIVTLRQEPVGQRMSELVGDNCRGRAVSSTKQQRELVVGESRHCVDAPGRELKGVAKPLLYSSRMFPSVLGDKPWQRVQADADDAGLATESFGPDQFFSERLDQAVPGRETGGGMRGIQPGQLALVRSQLAHEPYRQREKHCVRYEIPRQDADAGGYAGREFGD